MRPAVASIFVRFSQTYEGNIPWPYADCLGKITVGIGQLCDTPAEFRSLPWESHIGPATSDEIQHAYEELRAAAAYMSGHSAAGYEAVTSLRLEQGTIDELCLGKARAIDEFMCAKMPGYRLAPANAQLALLSMAYAVGSYGVLHGFPKFCSAYGVGDWATCALECYMDDRKNPGLSPRNRANRVLFAACCDPVDPDNIAGWPIPKTFPVGSP